MTGIVRGGLRLFRSVAGEDTALERRIRETVRSMKARRDRLQTGYDYALFWNGDRDARRLGIFLVGSCDLPAIFQAIPLIQSRLSGTCGMFKVGNIADARSDILLQTLDDLPADACAEALDRLRLRRSYFEPVLFEPEFRLPEQALDREPFRKNVVVLSVAADAVRTAYRHRETGLLVDPGGWWLDEVKDKVLDNLDTVKWFRESYESAGRMSARQFFDNYSRIVTILKERTGAEILVLNTLTVEPRNTIHCYQLVKNAHSRHRREINLALLELSRKHDIAVVDVDRVLKRVGIDDSQVDFAHFPPSLYGLVAEEVVSALRSRDVI